MWAFICLSPNRSTVPLPLFAATFYNRLPVRPNCWPLLIGWDRPSYSYGLLPRLYNPTPSHRLGLTAGLSHLVGTGPVSPMGLLPRLCNPHGPITPRRARTHPLLLLTCRLLRPRPNAGTYPRGRLGQLGPDLPSRPQTVLLGWLILPARGHATAAHRSPPPVYV